MPKPSKEKRDHPSSVKLTRDLNHRLKLLLPLRDITFSTLVATLLKEYLEKHPPTKEEQQFLRFKESTRAKATKK